MYSLAAIDLLEPAVLTVTHAQYSLVHVSSHKWRDFLYKEKIDVWIASGFGKSTSGICPRNLLTTNVELVTSFLHSSISPMISLNTL